MKPEEHRELVHRLFKGLADIGELKEKGGVVGGRSNSKPQMKDGAGAMKPGETAGADEGARARQPH